MPESLELVFQLAESLRLVVVKHFIGKDSPADDNLIAVHLQEDVALEDFRCIGLALIVFVSLVRLGEVLIYLIKYEAGVFAEVALHQGLPVDLFPVEDAFPVSGEEVRGEDDYGLLEVRRRHGVLPSFPFEDADGVAVRVFPVAPLIGGIAEEITVLADMRGVLVLRRHGVFPGPLDK